MKPATIRAGGASMARRAPMPSAMAGERAGAASVLAIPATVDPQATAVRQSFRRIDERRARTVSKHSESSLYTDITLVVHGSLRTPDNVHLDSYVKVGMLWP